MEEESKAAQRSSLILQLGRVLAPIHQLAERTTPPASADYRAIAATLRPDVDRWNSYCVGPFTMIGGHNFGHERDDIVRGPHNLVSQLADLARAKDDPAVIQQSLCNILKTCEEMTLEAIDRVPIEWEPKLLAAKTPFTVHMHIRDAIQTAKRRVHYCDRYLNADFFPLYLRELSRSLEIRLVTTHGNAGYGVINVRAVSALAAGEFPNFQLIECQHSDLHDRNLRIDDQIFFLGPSINAAGTHPTNFSPTDSSPAAHAVLDTMIARGSVVT